MAPLAPVPVPNFAAANNQVTLIKGTQQKSIRWHNRLSKESRAHFNALLLLSLNVANCHRFQSDELSSRTELLIGQLDHPDDPNHKFHQNSLNNINTPAVRLLFTRVLGSINADHITINEITTIQNKLANNLPLVLADVNHPGLRAVITRINADSTTISEITTIQNKLANNLPLTLADVNHLGLRAVITRINADSTTISEITTIQNKLANNLPLALADVNHLGLKAVITRINADHTTISEITIIQNKLANNLPLVQTDVNHLGLKAVITRINSGALVIQDINHITTQLFQSNLLENNWINENDRSNEIQMLARAVRSTQDSFILRTNLIRYFSENIIENLPSTWVNPISDAIIAQMPDAFKEKYRHTKNALALFERTQRANQNLAREHETITREKNTVESEMEKVKLHLDAKTFSIELIATLTNAKVKNLAESVWRFLEASFQANNAKFDEFKKELSAVKEENYRLRKKVNEFEKIKNEMKNFQKQQEEIEHLKKEQEEMKLLINNLINVNPALRMAQQIHPPPNSTASNPNLQNLNAISTNPSVATTRLSQTY